MFQFPFGTMHQLNLDWFLQQWQQLRQDWIDEEQHIEDSMQDIYDARDIAIQAKDDAVSAKNDAETAKTAADADALIAEGFAVGEQNGSPVGPGSPYYQVNAKFYSTNSGTYRYLSEAYARGTMGGTPVDPGDAGYEDNAKYYKDAAAASAQDASDDADYVRDHVTDADASALEAEGFAVGEQGGTPVASGSPYYENNAKYYAGEALQDKLDADTFKDAANQAALRSEGWSVGEQNGTPVGSGSPYYQNNAKYYAQNAAVSPYFKEVIPNKIIPLKYFSESLETLTALYGMTPSVLGNILYLSDYTNWGLSSKTIQLLYPVQEASSFPNIPTKSYIKLPAGNYILKAVLLEGSITEIDGTAPRIGYAALVDDSSNIFKTLNIPLNWNKFDTLSSNFTLTVETNVEIGFQLLGWADSHVTFKDVAIEILIESATEDVLNRNINVIEPDPGDERDPIDEREER